MGIYSKSQICKYKMCVHKGAIIWWLLYSIYNDGHKLLN